MKAGMNGYLYRCVITDANGNKTVSNTAKLTAKTKITTQPTATSVTVGANAVFTIKATGAGLTYQWQFRAPNSTTWTNSGANGCKTATVTFPMKAGMNGYLYRCVITDANGVKTVSDTAKLLLK